MAELGEDLFRADLVRIGDQVVFVGVGEAYNRNVPRIYGLARLDDQLGVQCVREAGDDIIVSLKPGFEWTAERFMAVRKLFA